MENINVLIVEDDEEDFLIARQLLTQVGSTKYQLAWAQSYEDGLAQLAQQEYDICLFDYRLNGHTGLELLRAAREAGYKGPMVLLTGLGDPEIDLEAMRAGAADYLVKDGLSAALLERSIRYSIMQWRNEQERLQLVKERVQAETAAIAKDEFIALISHELRNPLNSILGWARVLVQGRANATIAEQAALTIERSAELQKRLIDDLLDLARVSGGKLRLETHALDLAPVLQQALDASSFTAEAKGIELRARLDANAGQVTGDAARLQQVTWNLLSNALKFTPEGGRVELELSRSGPHVQIQVRDTGCGISPEFLPHVFEQYRQADEASGQRRGGLGIGLTLARQLVEAHGGTIEADSPGIGEGSTFTVKLPVRAVRAAPALVENVVRLNGRRVLVVDDDPDSRELITLSLEACGATVATVASAEETLRYLAANPLPEILISDIGMPEMDGFALIEQIRALPAQQGGNIPAVALTAYGGHEDRIRVLTAGFQAHVSKPVEPTELALVIAALINVPGGRAVGAR